MEVALVNTNRYRHPPVLPVGAEYLVAPLERTGHAVSFLDLAFTAEPLGALVSFLDASKHDVIGFSVRNVDTASFGSSAFFLDDIATLVAAAKEHGGKPVVVGGSATHCSREALRRYLGADYLVAGPGEVAFPELLDAVASGSPPAPVIDGWSRGIIPDLSHPRGQSVDFKPYLEGGDPAGIEFRKGCDWGCPFCVERERPLMSRNVTAVIEEARSLAGAGAGAVFLCDSEVNLDLEGTNAFLSALAEADLGLDWYGYFRAVPFDQLTARLAVRSGFRKVTLWVSSWELSAEGGPYSSSDVTRFLSLCEAEGIRVAVDLLVGYPGESRDSVERALGFMAGERPATVGVTAHIRLYEGTPVADDALRAEGRLLGGSGDNAGMLRPVFYSGLEDGWLEGKLAGDPLFVLEGTRQTVNYQRL